MKKIIQITAKNIRLFDSNVRIDFYAKQRARDDDLFITPLFDNFFTPNILAFTGRNASGKTCTLKLIAFSIGVLAGRSLSELLLSMNINDITSENERICLEIVYHENSAVYKLVIGFKWMRSKETGSPQVVILDECLKSKSYGIIRKKADLTDDKGYKVVKERDSAAEYLQADASIITGVNKENGGSGIFLRNEMVHTNYNYLTNMKSFGFESMLNFLDDSVEYVHFEESGSGTAARLKFKKEDKEKVLDSINLLNNYLSSGTIKGLNVFANVLSVLEEGGYYILDEVENHFNREIVGTLIRLFTSRQTNPHGAVMIFSTHYPELFDTFSRNDIIYITRHHSGGIGVSCLCDELNRNDISRSELFHSDYLGGTSPSYDAYIDLKEKIELAFKENRV